MKTLNTMSLVLSSNQYHAGLSEICRQFEGDQSDEYLSGLVNDLALVNAKLFDVMHINKVRRNVEKENRQLNESLVAALRYIASFNYVADAEMKASAAALMQLFDSYDKPFVRMKVDERVGAVSTALRDLAKPAMQEHVERLPELAGRIQRIHGCLNDLKVALHEADKAHSSDQSQPLMPLKRDAAAKLELLVDYLKAMAEKDSATYGGHYAVVTEIIKRLNATMHRNTYLRVEVELEDNEDTTEELQPTAVSA